MRETGVVKLMTQGRMTVVCIPKVFVRNLHWQPGDRVVMTIENDQLWIQTIEPHLIAMTSPSTREAPDATKG